MVINTSGDLLTIAWAFVIIWVGLCLGWGLFYVAMILRNFWMISSSVKKKLEFLDQILSLVKNKVETSASYLPPLMEGISKIAEAFNKRQAGSKKSGRRK